MFTSSRFLGFALAAAAYCVGHARAAGDPAVAADHGDANPPSWPPVLPPVWPTMFRAQVHGSQRGIAGNVIFYNESAHHNVTLSGAWYYDFPRNQMRADYAEYVNGVFKRDLTPVKQ